MRTLNNHGIEAEAPIEVAFWTNQEGSRFVPLMMGSGVFSGAFTLEHAYAATDTEGKTVKDELARIGYIGEQVPGELAIGAYFETHIEQGLVLEDHGIAIGVVQDVVASALRHPPHGRGTVGMVQVLTNSRNVIPGRVKFSIDLRNATDALVDEMAGEVKACAARLGQQSGLDIRIELVSGYSAIGFHAGCIDAVARAAQKPGYSKMPVRVPGTTRCT